MGWISVIVSVNKPLFGGWSTDYLSSVALKVITLMLLHEIELGTTFSLYICGLDVIFLKHNPLFLPFLSDEGSDVCWIKWDSSDKQTDKPTSTPIGCYKQANKQTNTQAPLMETNKCHKVSVVRAKNGHYLCHIYNLTKDSSLPFIYRHLSQLTVHMQLIIFIAKAVHVTISVITGL